MPQDLTTPQGRADFIQSAIPDTFLQRLALINDRWKDESQYEDWKDYDAVLKSTALALCPAFTVVKTQKRPLGVVLRHDGLPYDVLAYTTARNAGWKSVPRT